MAARILRKKQTAKKRQHLLVQESIRVYFDEAHARFATHPDLSHRYMRMARRMAMRFRMRIPAELRWRMCKNCLHYLVPGTNARVRVGKKMRIVLCKDCKHITRFRYKR